MTLRLLSSAERFSTATGIGKSPRSRFKPRPARSPTRTMDPSSGRPLVPTGRLMPAMSLRRKIAASARWLQGDHFYFDLGVDHQGRLHAGARWQRLLEVTA